MSRIFRVISILTIAIVLVPLRSFPAEFTAPISVLPATTSEAIQLAIQNRAEIRMENIQSAINWDDIKIAKGSFLPTLDFQADYTQTRTYDKFSGYTVSVQVYDQIFTSQVEQTTDPRALHSALGFSYNLYSGGKDAAALEGAKANYAAEESQKEITRRKVVLDVSTAYWKLRKAQISLSIAERWRDYYLNSLKIAETRLKAGQIPAIEKELAYLHFREQEVAVIQARRELFVNIKKYRQALGLNSNEDTVDMQQIPQLTDNPDQEVSFPAPVLQEHPELLKINSEISAARAQIKTEHAEFYPKLDFFANYSVVGRGNTINSPWNEKRTNAYVVGFQLSINLFGGFKNWNKSDQAGRKEELARIRLIQKEADLALLMDEKSTNIDKAKDDLILAQERYRVSEAKEMIARMQRKTGSYSESEYLKEQGNLQEGADQLVMAKIDIMLAQLSLAFVTTQ